MSQEQVLKTLVGLGLTRLDSQVYIYLSKRGPQKGQDLSKGLKVQKQQLYRSLKTLQSKGIVSSTLEHPARFNAVSFDKVVDIFIKAKMAEAQHIQEQKTDLLANWQAISIGETVDATAKFNVIEGRGPIYAKILQMMNETTNQLSTITTITGLLRADQFGLFEPGIENRLRPRIKFRALTELSEQNLSVTKKFLKEIANAKTNFEGRTPDLNLTLPQMVIRDEEEILFFITSKMNAPATEQEDICLWTNCKSLVQAFTAVFEDFWRNSTNIEAKIVEIETGKLATKTYIIKDTETANQKYNEILNSANKEITIVTSSEGLTELWRDQRLPNKWTRRGVSVRIMAPITSRNIEAAQQLPKGCEVRHISIGYLGTTIVDGQHLFQFKNTSLSREKLDSKPNFENTFYTDDVEYVEKTRAMLNDVWRNAQVPSGFTLESIASATIASASEHVVYKATKKMLDTHPIENKEYARQLTEKSIIEKIIQAKRYPPSPESKGIVKTCSTNCQAVIHPPSDLNLPDMLFHTYHMEKCSTFGTEDAMVIFLWANTPKGYFYVPTAVITDNIEAVDFWKKVCANSPAGENVQLLKKDEFETRIHGNTLFAAWTVTIPLIPPHKLLPACLQVEGYGKIITNAYTSNLPSGYMLKTEGNILEAFITFYLPSLKYSGPGTDGAFGRDVIIEFHPPQG